jgi:hypothetical protein
MITREPFVASLALTLLASKQKGLLCLVRAWLRLGVFACVVACAAPGCIEPGLLVSCYTRCPPILRCLTASTTSRSPSGKPKCASRCAPRTTTRVCILCVYVYPHTPRTCRALKFEQLPKIDWTNQAQIELLFPAYKREANKMLAAGTFHRVYHSPACSAREGGVVWCAGRVRGEFLAC